MFPPCSPTRMRERGRKCGGLGEVGEKESVCVRVLVCVLGVYYIFIISAACVVLCV